MNTIATVILAYLVLLSSMGNAYPTNGHYQIATEPAELALDSLTHWDAEASSDFIVYQFALSRDVDWWRKNKVFDLTAGSISSKQFLFYKRLKLEQDLTEKVQLRLQWLEAGDFEQDRSALPLELKFELTERWAFSLFGTPSLYKAEDDVGVSLFFTPLPEWEWRLSGLWGDFQRNKRTLQNDEWSKVPFAATLSLMHAPPGPNFTRAEVHWETLSQRQVANSPTTELQHHSFYLISSRALDHDADVGLRFLYDHSYHSDYVLNTVSARNRWLTQLEYSRAIGPHRIRPGLNLFYRENRLHADQVLTREVLPALWFDLPSRSRAWGTKQLSLGYDATVFDQQNSHTHDRNLEHRLNLKSNMIFNKSGELALMFTFDLDQFGSGETWEGGAAQFHLDF